MTHAAGRNPTHGTTTAYTDGCRCHDCRAASAAYTADLRARKAAETRRAERAARLAAGITDHPDWFRTAACNDPAVTPRQRLAIFYPVVADDAYHYTPHESAYAAAKAICATCPVRDECLDHALATRERQGVWGGLDPQERRRETRRRAARRKAS